jgi:imidazolonepropionase
MKNRGEPSDLLGIISDGAVVIDRGKIVWTGTTADFRKLDVHPAKIIEASQKTVTPGLIDPHTHLAFAGSREDELAKKARGSTYLEILQRGGGIARTIRATREATESEILTQTRERLRQLLRNGVTSVEVKTGYGQDLVNELKLLRVIDRLAEDGILDVTSTFLGLHSVPSEFKSSSDYVRYVKKVVLPEVCARTRKPAFADCFCEEGVFSYEECQGYLKTSRSLGLQLKIHADEFTDSNGARLAAEADCVSADHLGRSSVVGLNKMGKKGVIAVILPGTSLYSGIKPANVKEVLQSGCKIALGTDLCPNSWIESPQIVMALACTMLRLPPELALLGFTRNAAAAIAREDLGTLALGNVGDLVIYDFPSYEFLPYRVGGSYVNTVIKRGHVVYQAAN